MGIHPPKKILLVDDDRHDVILMISALREANFGNEIIVAEDGEEALDVLYKRGKFAETHSDKPVFILLDIKMPMMNGIEVLKLIRGDRSFDNVPIVMMTSSNDTRDLEECYENGANSYVVKPVKISDFIKVVKNIGQYWIVVNEISS